MSTGLLSRRLHIDEPAASQVHFTFAPAMTPESLHATSKAPTFKPVVLPTLPPMQSCPPARAPSTRVLPSRASFALPEPYPTTEPKRRRSKPPSANKRAMNAFLIYRRSFPRMYPHIDALERHQGPKSEIIGAMWRSEAPDVKQHFFALQETAAEQFRAASGQIALPKSDPAKTRIRRDKARERRAREEKLAPRSELIVRLWQEEKNEQEMLAAVKEFDDRQENKFGAPLYVEVEPLANQTNTPRCHTPMCHTPSPVMCHSALSSPASHSSPMSFHSPSPAPQAEPRIVNAELEDQSGSCLNDYVAGLPKQPFPDFEVTQELLRQFYEPIDVASSEWSYYPPQEPATLYQTTTTITYEAPLDTVMGDGSTIDPRMLGSHTFTTYELGGEQNLDWLATYDPRITLEDNVASLLDYYSGLASTYPEYPEYR